MQTYDIIFNDYEARLISDHKNAIDFAQQTIFDEIETTENSTYLYCDHVETINNVEIYYNYGADYYFFVEVE